ncbi:hypothetical protein LY78DRAFT_450677 [Colletotrichum sublineola]|nr:hypothetical protein LY78DRAFT_450677 [Colletotrichum sublineola]
MLHSRPPFQRRTPSLSTLPQKMIVTFGHVKLVTRNNSFQSCQNTILIACYSSLRSKRAQKSSTHLRPISLGRNIVMDRKLYQPMEYSDMDSFYPVSPSWISFAHLSPGTRLLSTTRVRGCPPPSTYVPRTNNQQRTSRRMRTTDVDCPRKAKRGRGETCFCCTACRVMAQVKTVTGDEGGACSVGPFSGMTSSRSPKPPEILHAADRRLV